MYMNEDEIDQAREQYRNHPILGPATETLSALKDAVNANSDGWPYYSAPLRASAKLMVLIDRRWTDREPQPTRELLRAAYIPIKAFRTRTGIQFEITEPKT